MIDSFAPLLDWIAQHPEYAGWVIFGMAFAESLAIIGILVPGVVILFGAGTLIGSGVLEFWPMCAWAVAGAILGDGISYAIGHHFDYLAERWRWFRLHPDHLERAHRFFVQWGDVSIVLGRFFGPIRALVPLVAGLMDMPPKRFYLANVLSALAWAPAYLLPGMLVGEAVDEGNWTRVGVAGAGVAVVLGLLFLLRKRFT
ncbi:DedA family protein [endosymbiont of unidentified scaly snail isolate Monju]|uniref:DedA family protein n=1 Tax=endosymbiont of unidentified scaly snail isolate Monju TaxID=1248727 RepID=UPI0003891D64|nr:DedA family protein [endosymbiont of unidentified scaly snail isolate Monju]BAN69910.1 DedA family protein [endosymbiont of unidentified scaly snail isolate Monju]